MVAPASVLSHLRLPIPAVSAPARFRVQGWDPLLIVSQIVSLQALHYLTLSILLPPLLATFASPLLLSYEGGPSCVSMIMDWREFTGLSTVSIAAAKGAMGGLVGLAATAAKGMDGMGMTADELEEGLIRVVEADLTRGWTVAIGWVVASLTDVVFLYHLVRRPTHILDFCLTLIFNHTILTTYYSGHFPTSLFYWLVLVSSSIAQVVLAEQWCVQREMKEGFSVDAGAAGPAGSGTPSTTGREAGAARREDVEMGSFAKKGTGNGGKGYERVPMEDR